MTDLPRIINTPLDCALAEQSRQHVAVMGNMDGVHKGHQALIEEARRLSDDLNKPLGAIVFEPHPRVVFNPGGDPFLLTTQEQKAVLLGDHGVETVFILPFNRHLSMLEPEAFVSDILSGVMGLAGIVVGEEFRFGRRRAGTAEMLSELGNDAGMVVKIVEPTSLSTTDEKFSSSQARQALRDGDPKRATDILGRPWTVRGIVQKGQQLGRTLNFPTANISLGNYLQPARGVYAVTAHIHGDSFKGVANFGSRPTVDGKGVLLEVYMFDFDQDIYGEFLDVEFQHFIRSEQRFSDIDALRAQITKDCEQAAILLS